MKKAINGTIIQFTFDGLEPVTFDPAKAAPAMRSHAEMHGWLARIGDKAAIQKSADNNYTVTEEMRRNAVLEMVAHYESGIQQWELKTAKGKAFPIIPAVQAYAEKTGKSYNEALIWFNAKMIEEIENMPE